MTERAVAWTRAAALVVGPLVALAEVARRWGEAGFFPKAFDDVLVAILLVAAATAPASQRSRLLFGAWAFFAGMVLTAFVTNLDYLLRHDARASAGFTIILGLLLLGGLFAATVLRRPTARE